MLRSVLGLHGLAGYALVMPLDESNPSLDRVRFALRATGLPSETPQPHRSGIHSRGYLPHVKREDAACFVTFRLADSLPQEVLFQLNAERTECLRRLLAATNSPTPEMEEIINRDHLRRVERFLDRGVGACWLRRPDLAELMSNALRHFDGQRYRLSAWVVMPNHVHAVLWPMPNHLLGDILKSWKGYTAHEFNQRLQQTGQTFWQPESFDHWIRYVVHNPVTARLCATPEEWRWSSAWPGGSHPQKS
jgi:REP element-mobilizing transposase RayT